MRRFASGMDSLGYAYRADPTKLTTLLKGLLWMSLAMNGILLLSDVMELRLLNRESLTVAEWDANLARRLNLRRADFVVAATTAVVFLMWAYRANSNCHGFGARGMEFRPRWSVGCYFIPIMNLFKPYQAMKEIWKVSSNPAEWKKQEATALLGFWWGLSIFTVFLWQAALRARMTAKTIEELQTSAKMAAIEDILDTLLCLAAITLIGGIAARQQKLVRPRSHNW